MPTSRPSRGAWDRVADLAALAIAAWWLARLVPQALLARLHTDECFHATMASWLAAHHALPVVFPGLYSGLYCYYPPLYHIVGGIAVAAFGVAGFKLVNVAVSAAIVALAYTGARRLGAPPAGRWAVCLCVANAWLSYHAVRMYAEQLTTLLVLGAILGIVALARIVPGGGAPERSARTRAAVGLGVTVGLALVAKNSSLVLLALIAGLAGLEAARGARDRGRALALAGGVALAVAAPMFARNFALYGSPIYPAFAPDLHPLLYRLNASKYTPMPRVFYLTMALYMGPAIGAFVLAALARTVVARRWRIEAGLLAVCVALVLLGPLEPLLDPRHLLPAIVAMAALGAIVVADTLAGRRAATVAIDLLLLALAATCVATMKDYRRLLDLPPDNDAVMAAVREHVPERESLLSLYTYDTYYYTQRSSTWPIPWGQKEHPLEMFQTSDCDSVVGAFARHRLRYALVPTSASADTFDGANFPRPFVSCMAELLEQGRIAVLWHSPTTALVRIGP